MGQPQWSGTSLRNIALGNKSSKSPERGPVLRKFVAALKDSSLQKKIRERNPKDKRAVSAARNATVNRVLALHEAHDEHRSQ